MRATLTNSLFRALEPIQDVGVGQARDRDHHTRAQISQTGLHHLVGLHSRYGAHVHALSAVEFRAHNARADHLDPDAVRTELTREHLGKGHQK